MTHVSGHTILTDYDVHLFNEGKHFQAFEKLGAHICAVEGESGTQFAVWAPNAKQVSVIGDFNGWTPGEHKLLMPHRDSGIWEGFITGVGKGERYKYHIVSNNRGYTAQKGDPFAFKWEVPPKTASVVWEDIFGWGDEEWMKNRKERSSLSSPISIYEVHLGSWRRIPEDGNRPLGYREAAPLLADYAVDNGFTHVEFLPLMEHPFYGSWGYQITGYFAPTSRYGDPEDLACLVDHLHRRGVGVIFDWVPSHFPNDPHGLGFFDGTHLFEHDDPRRGVHPEWNSFIFNYGRREVRSFLISNAMFWLREFHVDALRVDAVASMLYLDYGRKEGEWIPNKRGGRENLEALSFLKDLNEAVYASLPGAQMIAEESTAWPLVSKPTDRGGLGFGYKWNMGWMHDTLAYISRNPVHRKYHHDQLTFSLWYAFSENYILPFSHDEVVYGKGSLLRKMPGDDWQKFANLRLLLGYMYSHPGKKLLFMGSEMGQWDEWSHEKSLDWHLLSYEPHAGVQRLVRDLNGILRNERALHELDSSSDGFEWVDFHDWEQSVIIFVRKAKDGEKVLCAFNFTPIPRKGYRIGVPEAGLWKEVLNTDAKEYGGSGIGNGGAVRAVGTSSHGRPFSLELVLPPLSCVYLTNPRG